MADNTTVFIVDDDTFILDMYATKFKEEGYAVETRANGEDALALLQERAQQGEQIDIMLLDIAMPEMDGFDVLERMHSEGLAPQMPVIILSNMNEHEDHEKASQYGVVDYIVKANLTPAEVLAQVEKALWDAA
jgi:CheY-like chemotaxis protein